MQRHCCARPLQRRVRRAVSRHARTPSITFVVRERTRFARPAAFASSGGPTAASILVQTPSTPWIPLQSAKRVRWRTDLDRPVPPEGPALPVHQSSGHAWRPHRSPPATLRKRYPPSEDLSSLSPRLQPPPDQVPPRTWQGPQRKAGQRRRYCPERLTPESSPATAAQPLASGAAPCSAAMWISAWGL